MFTGFSRGAEFKWSRRVPILCYRAPDNGGPVATQ